MTMVRWPDNEESQPQKGQWRYFGGDETFTFEKRHLQPVPPQAPIEPPLSKPLTGRPTLIPAVIDIPTAVVLPTRNWTPVNIAVADITAYALSQTEAKTLTERVHSTLVQTDYFTVLSQSDMKAVLEMQQFQRTDACDDTSCLVEMGKILSVQKIIGGTLGKVGSTFSISLRFVDVETGKTDFTVDDEWRGESDALLKLVRETTKRLAAEYARRKVTQ